MNKKQISIVIIFLILFMGGGFMFFNKKAYIYNKNDEISFTATITDAPKQDGEKNDYFIHFDNVIASNNKDTKNLAVFNHGGSLTAPLFADKTIKIGSKIDVVLKKNFATTRSIPPQILEDGLIRVDFK